MDVMAHFAEILKRAKEENALESKRKRGTIEMGNPVTLMSPQELSCVWVMRARRNE